MMTDLVDRLTNLHLDILADLLAGDDFDQIQQDYADEMANTNYLEIMIDRANRLTFNDDNELIGAYPVCPIPTEHEVEIEGVGNGYAMCAIDALGMAYTFNSKTTIRSKTSDNDSDIQIEIDPSTEQVPETDIVVTYQKLGHDSLREMVAANAQLAVDACPMINFYSSRDAVDDEELELLSINEAVSEAKSIFSPEGIANHIRESL